MPDFVGMPPRPEDDGFAAELARLRTTSFARARSEIDYACWGEVPRELDRPDIVDRIADLLAWTWAETVEPDWARRSRIFEADVVSRISRLARQGWREAVAELVPQMRWLGDGRLQINASDRPARDLAGAELVFVPSSARRGWVAWDLPERYAVIYPAAGLLAEPQVRAPAALGRLLGGSRAELLTRLEPPRSTSQLAAITGLAIGTVGDHLRVLLDARLVARRRSGASVYYYRTELGEQLVGAAD
jgi:DNA-binding transcriptional ArsR family regulator